MKKATFMAPCAVAAMLLWNTSAFALDKPSASPYDKRIQHVAYNASDIVPLVAANGIVTNIIFGEGEQIQNYVTGFSSAWEFAAVGNHFFLKPREEQGQTNLVIVTDRHTYVFDLNTHWKSSLATYQLRFTYPQEEQAKREREAEKNEVKERLQQSPTAAVNRRYTMNFGSAPESRQIAPVEAFDNGQFTFLRFAENADFPAVYRHTSEGEILINSHVEKGYLVIHGLYPELMLRAGQAVVGIYNESFSGGSSPVAEGVTVPGLERTVIGGDGVTQ